MRLGVVVFCFSLIYLSAQALASSKIALLIGNQTYSEKVGLLKNPHNDIEIVASALRQAGFEVLPLVKDAKRIEILKAVTEFSLKLKAAGPKAVGFFYYSGHGAAQQQNGRNYLIPVDVQSAGSSEMWYQSVALDNLVDIIQRNAPTASRFIVFDACRNELQTPSKSLSKGFAPIKTIGGTFIAFSTSPDTQASDVGEGTGPYALALANELAKPQQNHMDLFFNVRKRVADKTNNQQIPWDRNGLLTRIVFNDKGNSEKTEKKLASLLPAHSNTGTGNFSEAGKLWEQLKKLDDVALIEAFAKKFKDDPIYSALARNKLKELIGSYDGVWMLSYAGNNCRINTSSFKFMVKNGHARRGKRLWGSVSRQGDLSLTGVSKQSKKRGKVFTGAISGNSGAGVFRGLGGGQCTGRFKIKLVRRLREGEGSTITASIPKTEKPQKIPQTPPPVIQHKEKKQRAHPFDGRWKITKVNPRCKGKRVFYIFIRNGRFRNRAGAGYVKRSGAITMPGLSGKQFYGKLKNNSGSGAWGRCNATLTRVGG